MKGTLSPGTLPALLRQLYVSRLTGVLQLSREQENVSFRLLQGQLVQATTSSGVSRPPRGEGVDDEQYAQALMTHVRDTFLAVLDWSGGYYSFAEQSEEGALGDDATRRVPTGELILEAVRRLSDAEVIRASLGDLDRVLISSTDPMLRYQKLAFTPGDGYTLSRIDGISTAREVIQLIPLPAEDVEKSLLGLLCTGVIEYVPRAKAARPRPAPVPPAREEPPRAAPSPASTPARAAAPSPAPVVSAPAAPPPPSPPSAEALREKEVAQRRQEIVDAHKDLKQKTHFEILGIPRASNEAQVKEAYFRLARRFHPDTQKHPELADLEDKMEAVFIRLGEAYEVLRNPRSRAQYEEYIGHRSRLHPPTASTPSPEIPSPTQEPPAEAPRPADRIDLKAAAEAVRKAEKALENNQAWDAIQLVEGALPALEGKPRHRANVLLARAFLRNPMWVRRAEETLLKVIQEAPQNVEAHFVLAGIYKDQGLKSRATSMYRRVMDLQPDHEGAARELAELSPVQPDPPEDRGGGLLRKLFGRN